MEKEVQLHLEKTENKGIPASVLKWIAIITMFIDHLGAGLIEVGILGNIFIEDAMSNIMSLTEVEFTWILINFAMRFIGRIAFPIFVFLLVEGFFLTSNRKKMVLRMLFFALLSEIPYDLCFENTFFSLKVQNVYFTLLLGFLAMCGLEWIKEKFSGEKFTIFLLSIGITILFMILNHFLRADYASMGIFAIVIFYFFHGGNRKRRVYATVIGFWFEFIIAYPAAIPLYFYNGERGKQNKYFFYFFYPVHILAIYIFRLLLVTSSFL